jgi:hypothetical protein
LVLESADFGFSYKFSETDKEYKVKLVVKDSQDREAVYEQDVFVFSYPVPKPNPLENYKDLLGVDSDNDDIRDDVQRSIWNYAENDNLLKSDLLELAKIYQRLMSTEDTTESVNRVYKDLLQFNVCNKKKYDDDKLSALDEQMSSLYFNSLDRTIKLMKINDLLLQETLDFKYTEEGCL